MEAERCVRLSKWCHVFERQDIVALFHSVNLGVAYLDSEDARNLIEAAKGQWVSCALLNELLEKDTVQLLLDEGLITERIEKDDESLTAIREQLKKDITLELLYLLVTDNCNLRCRYCFEETPTACSGNFQPVTMSQETARLAIETFARLSSRYGDPKRTKVIHLYGGEPMLNYEIVRYAVEQAERMKNASLLSSNMEFAIVTNGTLLADEHAEFFERHHVTVGLSLDGSREINNLYRISKKRGIDVYAEAIRAYDILKRRGVSVGISVTLTPESVDRFDELLELFSTKLADANGFSLNIMHFNREVEPPADYYKKAVQCQLAAFELFRSRDIFEERVMRKARSFVDRIPIYADCGVIGNQLVVAPDGSIGVCQDFVKPRTYFSGDVRDPAFDPIIANLFSDWRDRSPLNMPECQNCPALGICGGGCPASAELKHGSRWRIDERICHHSKDVLEWLIWDTYAKLS